MFSMRFSLFLLRIYREAKHGRKAYKEGRTEGREGEEGTKTQEDRDFRSMSCRVFEEVGRSIPPPASLPPPSSFVFSFLFFFIGEKA